MKKIVLITLTVFLNIGMFSCTPNAVSEGEQATVDCCGDDVPIPPPSSEDGD